MAETDPLSQMFNLFAAPLAGTIQSFEQFRKGVDEFLQGVENFNRTMENLNEITQRINSIVSELEAPIRAAIPQMTRTIKTADDMMKVVSGPAMAAAPAIERLAQTLSTPAFAQLPNQLGQFSVILGDLQSRLGSVTHLADSASGLFGGLKFPGMGGGGRQAPRVEPPPAPAAPPKKAATKKAATKKAAARKKTAKKKTAAKKA